MGWRDDPVVEDGAAAPRPRWAQDPIADEPAAAPLKEYKLADTVPGADGKLFNPDGSEYAAPPPSAPTPERSWLDDIGDVRILPDLDVRSIWTAIKGAPETAFNAVGNLATAGVAGLTAPFVADSDEDAAGYIESFMAENALQPRGESARELTGALGDAFAPVENAKQGLGDALLEATDSPLAATAGYMAPELASVIFGPKPPVGKYGTADVQVGSQNLGPVTTKTTSEAVPPPRRVPRPDPANPVETARAAGYKLLPSDIERATGRKPGLGERLAEALAPDDVRRDMTMENQQATNQLAREKVGALEGARLDRRGLKEQKNPHFETYQEVEEAVNLVPPSEDYLFALDAAQARAKPKPGTKLSVLDTISTLRRSAKKKQNNPNSDPKIEADGDLDAAAADALEDALGAELKATGQEELLAKYQSARQSLAEINDFDATQRAGNVDAQKIYKRNEKTPDRMTGQTKLIADVAENFPDATRSSMSAAGRKKAGGAIDKENILKAGAKKVARGAAKVVGLGDRLLVESEGFQKRLGETATPEERSYFSDYGKKPAKKTPAASPEPGQPPNDPRVVPSKAVTLSDRLELAPEDVPDAQVLPETPDRLTADTVPQARRGDVEFTPSRLGDELAGDLELDIRSGTRGAVGEKELSDLIAAQRSDELEVAPPREMEQLEFPARGEASNPLQLTRPNQRAKVSAARDKSGNVTVRHADGGEITAIELPEQGRMQIKDSKVPEGARGQGRGQAMTQQLLAMAKKKGLQLVSDTRVSESAQAMWKALKAKGLNVKQNPATRQASGELVSKSELKPVFEILDDAVTE